MPCINTCRPLPQESTYSVLCRAHARSGEKIPLVTLKHLTGLRGYKPLSGLPTKLPMLVSNLDIKGGISELIKHHTHFPLYAHFITPEKQVFVRQAMVEGGAPKSRLGLLRSDVQAKETIRYCKECRDNDIRSFGVAYWHREHLLPGVYVCCRHGVSLCLGDEKRLYGDRQLILPSNKIVNNYYWGQAAEDRLIFIAKQYQILLESQPTGTLNTKVYKRLLKEFGFETKHAHLRQKKLFRLVRDWLHPIRDLDVFERMYRALRVERNWVAQLVAGREGFHHPLKHIVLWGALGLDLCNIRNYSRAYGAQLELDLSMNQPADISRDIIVNAFKEYGTLTLTATHLNICVTTLSVLAEIHGVDYCRKTKKLTADIKEQVCSGFMEGMKSAELAAKNGISVSSVNRILRVFRER